MPKYKYFADWDGGSMIAKSLKELCEQINEKFSYLNTPVPPDARHRAWTEEEVIYHNEIQD